MLLSLLSPASSAVMVTDCDYRRVAWRNSSSSAGCVSRTLYALRNSRTAHFFAASRKQVLRSQRVRRGAVTKMRASLTTGEADPSVTVDEEGEEEQLRSTPTSKVDVSQQVALLKTAAQTRKVPPRELLVAINAIDDAKVDPSDFLQKIGGTESPGRTWMLIFTADKKLVKDSRDGGPGGGYYLPVTAVQGFDAVEMRNTNGIFLGPIGSLEFEGRFSWKNRILAFIYEKLILKVGHLGPFTINIAKKEDAGRTPGNTDPFFVWFYADDEILVARGRSGGVAFWCRCARVLQ